MHPDILPRAIFIKMAIVVRGPRCDQQQRATFHHCLTPGSADIALPGQGQSHQPVARTVQPQCLGLADALKLQIAKDVAGQG